MLYSDQRGNENLYIGTRIKKYEFGDSGEMTLGDRSRPTSRSSPIRDSTIVGFDIFCGTCGESCQYDIRVEAGTRDPSALTRVGGLIRRQTQ